MTENLNADFSQFAWADTAAMPWQESPSARVLRKRLDLAGPKEAGRVTSVVQYLPESRFAPHPHPDGEEILVLSGVFSDEHGDYPAGTYLLNPEGFSHAPYSEAGCELFVKLRQYPGRDRQQITLRTDDMPWQQGGRPGRRLKQLFSDPDYPESMRLVSLDPGTEVEMHDHPGGEEVFILSGDLNDGSGKYRAGSWLRFPDGSRHAPYTETGAMLYVKVGHLS